MVYSAASAVEYTANQHSLSHDKTLQSDDGCIEDTLATAVRGTLPTARGVPSTLLYSVASAVEYTANQHSLSHDKTLQSEDG